MLFEELFMLISCLLSVGHTGEPWRTEITDPPRLVGFM